MTMLSSEYSPPQTMPPASQQGQQTATHPTQPTQPTQYRQDVAHQAYNGNGYIPVMIGATRVALTPIL